MGLAEDILNEIREEENKEDKKPDGVDKIEAQAQATKDEPSFFSETSRALIGGARDAAQGTFDVIDMAADYLNKKMPIPYEI